MLEANLLNFSCQSYVSLQPKWNEAAFSTWLNLPVALGSSLLPSPPHLNYITPWGSGPGPILSVPLGHESWFWGVHPRPSYSHTRQLFSDTGGLPEWVCPSAQGSYSRFLWLSLHSWTLSPVHHNVSCSFILTSDLASWSWPSDPSGWHGSNRPCSTLRTLPPHHLPQPAMLILDWGEAETQWAQQISS